MSQIMEQLSNQYVPVPNFRIVNFSDGNINMDKIRKAATSFDYRDMMSKNDDDDSESFLEVDTEGNESRLINANNYQGDFLFEMNKDEAEHY